jgi:hypothetical protein
MAMPVDIAQKRGIFKIKLRNKQDKKWTAAVKLSRRLINAEFTLRHQLTTMNIPFKTVYKLPFSLDIMLVADDNAEELQECHLPQLETRVQCGPVNVRHTHCE